LKEIHLSIFSGDTRLQNDIAGNALAHFNKTGITDKLVKAFGVEPERFQGRRGFKNLYDFSVHITSLREQYPIEELPILELFSPLDWENIGRVISTYLFGSFTKWTLDGLATRNSLFLLEQLQSKIDFLKT
jgi:hypothetical protein